MKFTQIPKDPYRLREGWGKVPHKSCGGTGTEHGVFKNFGGSEFDCQEKCRKCNDCKFFEFDEKWRDKPVCYLYRTIKDIEEVKGEPYDLAADGKHRVVGPKICGKIILDIHYICCIFI